MIQFRINGQKVEKEEWDSRKGVGSIYQRVARRKNSTYPFASDAAGCHPDQVPEFQDLLKKKTGRHYDYTSDGRIVFESARARKLACEALHYYDKNAGYGDPQPQNH
jgi:hypothetical protein